MKIKKTIVYVNFSPYDNAGRFLDFLTASFDWVIHFSYDHLRLQNGRKTNILTVYHKRKVVERKQLIPLRTPEFLRFFSLPGVALLILFQTWWHTWRLKRKLEVIDYYFTVNAYTTWIGNILKRRKLVKKTIFWVWDYYPPGFPDWRLKFLRWIYWKFDRPALQGANKIVSISEKLVTLRFQLGALTPNHSYQIIPIGTNPIKKTLNKEKPVMGFMGMLKESQGLNLMFDNLSKLQEKFPHLKIEIVGSGPQETYFRQKAAKFKRMVRFYGYVEKENDVDKIIRRWSAGLATYLPVASNESYWTDPSKIKAYISQGVPVIVTNVPDFVNEIRKYKAGIVIDYHKPIQLFQAIQKLIDNQSFYSHNALNLSRRYYYKKLYPKFFL